MNLVSVKAMAMATAMFAIAFLFHSGVRAQSKIDSGKKSASRTVSEISDKDWATLAGTLSREEWDNSIRLSSQYLTQLASENDEKQMAQLRYLNLFALAGRLSSLIAGKNMPAIDPARKDLENRGKGFVGQELIMPPRTLSIDCVGKLNFVCPVKDNRKALRVTATNKNGDAILSFDYVLFEENVKIFEMDGKKVFLGGTLKSIDFNADDETPWMMRVVLMGGFARINVGQ